MQNSNSMHVPCGMRFFTFILLKVRITVEGFKIFHLIIRSAGVPFLILIFELLILGCGGNHVLVKLDAPDQFQKAKEFFDRKKYGDAIEEFKRVLFEHPGSAYVDDAQFYLGESYFLMEDYSQAVSEYDYLLRNFPESPFVENSEFRLGVSHYRQSPPYYLDQTETRKAIESFEEFMIKFPHSGFIQEAENFLTLGREKLAKKTLENGRLYYKRKEYSSAILYFQSLLSEYSESQYRREATYLLGECFERTGRREEALASYRDLLLGEDGFVQKAREKIEKLEKEG